MNFNKEITCRVCLKENRPKVDLFDGGGFHQKILTNTVGVEVAENEFFPTKICIECIVSLEYIENNVKTIRENEKKLRNMLMDLARAVANKKPGIAVCKNNEENALKSDVEQQHREMVVVIEKMVNPISLKKNFKEEIQIKQKESIIKKEPESNHSTDDLEIEGDIFDEVNENEDDEDDDEVLEAEAVLEEESISVDYSEKFQEENDSDSVDNDDPKDKDYRAPVGIPNYDLNLHCKECDKQFTRAANYNSHMMLHQVGVSFECEICQDKFVTQFALTKHRAEHKPKRAKRENFRHLYKNVRDSKTGLIMYECLECQKRFSRPGSICIHVKIHSKTHVCPFCGKNFASQHHLSQHENIHTGNKPYKCDFCPMAFAQLSSQADHRKIHTEIHREYQCDVCPKAFNHKRNLTLHKRRHESPRITAFDCDMCEDTFKSRLSLRKHVILDHPDYVFDKNDGKTYSIDKKTREQLLIVRKHRRRSENEREELKKQMMSQEVSNETL